MTRTGLKFVMALAGATLFAGGALAQTSTGSMSTEAMSTSGDHMSADKTTDHVSSDAMSSGHMAAHKHAKMAKKAKPDHMTTGAMAPSH